MNISKYLVLVDTMAKMSLKSEARRFFFGYVWWILEPLLYVGVFYVVFYELLGTRTPDFLIFLAVGKLSFIWFSKTVSSAASSIVVNRGLIGQADIPKTLFPVSVVLECSYRQMAVFTLLALILVVDGYLPSTHWFWVLPIMLVQWVLILACSLIAAWLVCLQRDFLPVINLAMVFLLFTSGVFWDINDVSKLHLADLLRTANPLAFLLDAYRDVLLRESDPDWEHLAGLFLVSGIVLSLVFVGMTKRSRSLAYRVVTS